MSMNLFLTKISIGVLRLVGSLPLTLNRGLGSFVGSYLYYTNSRSAKITRKNVSICQPNIRAEDIDQFVHTSLKETGKTAAEICYVWQRPVKHTYAVIENIEGEELITRALSRGKGLLMLAPHLGNWEALGLHLTRLAPVTNLYQPPKISGFDPLIRKSRTRNGSHLVPTSTKGVASLLKALKNNHICGILPDQNPNEEGSGEFANFFGEPAFTMTLIYKLIQRTDCDALFAFAKRTPKGFKLVFRAAPEGLFSKDLAESLRALNAGIENLVREAPEQYQWEYKRFKTHNPQRPVRHYA